MISELAFGGTWRRYQALALEAFEADRRSGDRRTHILAPPGSGKSRGPPATCAATCAQRLRRRASDSAVPWTRHSPRPDSPGTWFPGWSRVRPTDRSCCSSGCCAGSRRSRAGGSPSPTTSAVPSTGRSVCPRLATLARPERTPVHPAQRRGAGGGGRGAGRGRRLPDQFPPDLGLKPGWCCRDRRRLRLPVVRLSCGTWRAKPR